MGVSYDVHTHVGLDLGFYLSGWWPYACTAQELVGYLDRAGLDRAICFPFCLPSAFDPHAFAASRSLKLFPDRIPFDVEGEALIREIKQLGLADRLLPFAMFDPARCVPQQLTRLETLVGRIGGLKTQTTVLQSPISDLLDSASDFMTFAQRHDLPVLIHTAVHPDDHWAHAAECLDRLLGAPDPLPSRSTGLLRHCTSSRSNSSRLPISSSCTRSRPFDRGRSLPVGIRPPFFKLV